MSGCDIYEDLSSNSDLGAKILQLQQENDQLFHRIDSMEKDVLRLMNELTQMKKIEENLKKNISELYNTAKTEIARKDRMIGELRKQLDDLLFRRKNTIHTFKPEAANEFTGTSRNIKRIRADVHSEQEPNSKRIKQEQIKDSINTVDVPIKSEMSRRDLQESNSRRTKQEQINDRIHTVDVPMKSEVYRRDLQSEQQEWSNDKKIKQERMNFPISKVDVPTKSEMHHYDRYVDRIDKRHYRSRTSSKEREIHSNYQNKDYDYKKKSSSNNRDGSHSHPSSRESSRSRTSSKDRNKDGRSRSKSRDKEDFRRLIKNTDPHHNSSKKQSEHHDKKFSSSRRDYKHHSTSKKSHQEPKDYDDKKISKVNEEISKNTIDPKSGENKNASGAIKNEIEQKQEGINNLKTNSRVDPDPKNIDDVQPKPSENENPPSATQTIDKNKNSKDIKNVSDLGNNTTVILPNNNDLKETRTSEVCINNLEVVDKAVTQSDASNQDAISFEKSQNEELNAGDVTVTNTTLCDNSSDSSRNSIKLEVSSESSNNRIRLNARRRRCVIKMLN